MAVSTETTLNELQSRPGERVRAGESVRAGRRDRFFLGMAIALLAIVLLGFSRTLFLRAFVTVPPIGAFDYVHGLVQTSWFALLVAQASLVAAHRVDIHRRLGIAGAIVAILVVGLSLTTVLGYPARVAAGQVTTEGPLPDLPAASGIVWTDLASLLLFATFVGVALALRRRPETHRRLMLLASIAIITPAAVRMGQIFAMPLHVSAQSVSFRIVFTLGMLALPLLLVPHDLWTKRRLHPATLVGVSSYLVAMGAATFVSSTPAGLALIKALQ